MFDRLAQASADSRVVDVTHRSFRGFCDLMRETEDERRRHRWQEAWGRAVDAVAGLTAVDGATILTDRYELLGFGAKIARRKGSPQVEQMTVTEPIEGGVAAIMHPSQMGGTRHLSGKPVSCR